MKTRRRTWICAALAVGVLVTALVIGGPSDKATETPGAPMDPKPNRPGFVLQPKPAPKTGPVASSRGPVATSSGEVPVEVLPTTAAPIEAQPAGLESGK